MQIQEKYLLKDFIVKLRFGLLKFFEILVYDFKLFLDSIDF